jgi:hypothetical protein
MLERWTMDTTVTKNGEWTEIVVHGPTEDLWLDSFLDTIEAGIEATKSGRRVFALEA